ncbi:MAG: hypothetical protein AVDCRST_MAG33-1308 [uncultured Thermomicrobiales bacterium]|uniref:Uncharacterized protein n=1 Tax=uncultured Thermomicrobiales bacterium TaxID=1645740 RepID=A0A6J4UTZ8_9BACT|nr:MAG: hypothetical protein AVDCRST_MAG33-1308 [uncultured Thermomicrobiales bacterium]
MLVGPAHASAGDQTSISSVTHLTGSRARIFTDNLSGSEVARAGLDELLALVREPQRRSRGGPGAWSSRGSAQGDH